METYKRPDFVAGGITCDPARRQPHLWRLGRRGVLGGEPSAILHPARVPHGFLALSDTATFCYKCDDVYHPNDEGGLMWNDLAIGIEWSALEGDATFDPAQVLLSDKDKLHPPLADIVR